MYLPELEPGDYITLSSVSTEERDRQYKSNPKSHLVGRAKDRQSKGKSKIASAFKLSYMAMMFEPITLLHFDVYSQAV